MLNAMPGDKLTIDSLLPLLEAVEPYVRLLLHHPGSNRGFKESTVIPLRNQLKQSQEW